MDIPLPQPLLLDGATGTELQKRGMPLGVCTEQWALEHPEALLELQRAYVDAGAGVLTAPTFGASPAALERFGLAGETAEYNARLVALSREAAGGKALVAGDLAPCGIALAPAGEFSFEEIVDNYKAQVRAIQEAGVDLYIVETMITLAEARAAVLAIRETDRAKPILVSFYCDEEGRTPDGTDVLAALIVMQGMGVDGFGLNCAPPDHIAGQLERLAQYACVPLLAMPCSLESTPESFAALAGDYAARGVRFFGGCCGTGPEKIAALSRAVDGLHLPPFVPMEQDPDVIPCASGQEARFITPDVDVGETLSCTPDLLEDILRAEDLPQGAVKIAILDEDDLDLFTAYQYAVRNALCLWSDVPELLEKALRLYQGRAFWDHTADLEDEFLEAMRKKYGLVLL
ncbi:MAG TPA: homocysteine S-methyltransferase family protein [Pseudoflavonifractor sp.]|nr:homocysteine S-methyltransferase family protein [Pseudoflavonifractor sp.]